MQTKGSYQPPFYTQIVFCCKLSTGTISLPGWKLLTACDFRRMCVQVILETLAMAAANYTRKNLRILYDALSTLADAQRGNLAPHLPIFMPPLVARWQALADTDRELLPLLECFTSLAQALGVSPSQRLLCGALQQRPGLQVQACRQSITMLRAQAFSAHAIGEIL